MTIGKGDDWGHEADRPDDLRVVRDDAALAAALTDGSSIPTAVSGGDMFRTIGARPVGARTTLRVLPIDLVEVVVGDATLSAVSHVIARLPLRLGAWWRGPVLAVMNAEFVGRFDVAPRGHPNDGRVETLLADAVMPWRQRLAVRGRLESATHLPHPQIATRPVREATWDFERRVDIWVDGVRVGASRRLAIMVRPDAAVLWA